MYIIMRPIVLFIALLFCTHVITPVCAQSLGRISGLVQEDGHSPVINASVSLLKVKDSSLVKINISDSTGGFMFDGLKDDSYFILISYMGYGNFRSAPLVISQEISSVQLPAILLKKTAIKELKEVNVVSKKPMVEHQLDRTVVNVDALIANAGTTALDVLEKSPGIIVDQDGKISLKGKAGVTILIDNKPTYLTGADLENFLRSLPSSQLDKIEIMTNPPARYDASGNGGAINIKMKKSVVRGFNGSLNFSLTQGQKLGTNNSFNFNYRINKFNFFGNVGAGVRKRKGDMDNNRRFKNADGSIQYYYYEHSYNQGKGTLVNGKLGMDYYQSDRSTFGMVLTGLGWFGNDRDHSITNLQNAAKATYSKVDTYNNTDRTDRNAGINANYRYTSANKKHELTVDLDYIKYKNDIDQQFSNTVFDTGETVGNTNLLTGELPATIDIYTAKTDYTNTLKSGWNLSGGLKASYVKNNNIADYLNTNANVTKPDYDKSNHYIYKENINAAYINMLKEGARFSFQAGLRFENSSTNGHQMGNPSKPDSSFKNNYNSFFPTVYLSYKLDTLGNHQLSVNYGRRIDRPYYADLNPFVLAIDKFTYLVGNPFLKPSFTHNIELSHTYKDKLTTTLSYSNTKNQVSETIEIQDSLYYNRPQNIGRQIVMSIAIDGTFDLTKWLNLHLYAMVTDLHSKTNFYTGKLDTRGTYAMLNPVLAASFKKGWTTEISGTYTGRVHDVQIINEPIWQVNAGIQKKLSPVTTLKLGLTDIFRTKIYSGAILQLADADASYRLIRDSRRVTLTFSYRFGKAAANQRRHEATGADNEKNRVKE